MSEFQITRWVSGSSDEIEIDEARFTRICTAKDGIRLAIELEERLALVLESYHEFEVEVFSHGLRWTMHEDWRWESRRDQVFALNRRLLALLNSIWMYRDHADGEFKRRPSIPPEKQEELRSSLTSAFSSDSLLASLLLRNYCQHKSLGFEGVGVTNPWYEFRRRSPVGPLQEAVFTSAILAVKISGLPARRRHATRPILERLRSSGEDVWDPGPALRRAVDEITDFHSGIREELPVAIWREEIGSVIDTARQEFGNILGLCVVERFGRGNYGERVEIFPEPLERIEDLQARNGQRTSLSGRIVTAVQPFYQDPLRVEAEQSEE